MGACSTAGEQLNCGHACPWMLPAHQPGGANIPLAGPSQGPMSGFHLPHQPATCFCAKPAFLQPCAMDPARCSDGHTGPSHILVRAQAGGQVVTLMSLQRAQQAPCTGQHSDRLWPAPAMLGWRQQPAHLTPCGRAAHFRFTDTPGSHCAFIQHSSILTASCPVLQWEAASKSGQIQRVDSFINS